MSCNTNKCIPKSCACETFLKSDCINDVTANFECLNIESGQTLTETLEQMDAQICELFNSVTNYFNLINVGSGATIYKGIDNLGRRQIKSLTKTGDLLIISQSDNEIDFTIDEGELTNFINELIPVLEEVCIESDSLLVTEEEGCFKVELDVQSTTLTVTNPEPGVFVVEQPLSTTIPALYVNNLYVPTYDEWFLAGGSGDPTFLYVGDGSLAKPFTDSINYTSPSTSVITPNTAIQNALDNYVGSGTALAPEKIGQRIIVQDNRPNPSYQFSGNFNYAGVNIKLERNVISTTTGFLLDLDTLATDSVFVTIEIEEGVFLQIQGDGLNNTGNTQPGITYATGKIVSLLGEGTIYSAVDDITKYLINSDPLGTSNAGAGSNNDGNVVFDVRCKLRADYQGVYIVGGLCRVDLYSTITSGTIVNIVDPDLKAFHQTGGQVRMFSGSSVGFNGTYRDRAITFTPITPFTPSFISINTSFGGVARDLFSKTTSSNVVLEVTNSISGYDLSTTLIVSSPNLWQVLIKDNTFASGSIDIAQADLTIGNTVSAVNTVGNNVIESLRVFDSKNDANLAGLPRNGAFIKQKVVNADDLVQGVEYRVLTSGVPSLGFVNSYFTATGSENGTGTALLSTREVLI